MGRRGPPKTPPALDNLRGNPGKRGARRGGCLPSGDVTCPSWLGLYGQAKWNELVAKLSPVDGLLKPAFEDYLALYCEAYEEVLEAKDEIAKEGATCTSEKGGAYPHPAVGRKNKAIARMKLFGSYFGMSPVHEAELPSMGGVSDEETDPMRALLNSRN